MKNLKLIGLVLAATLAAPSLANAEYKILERIKVGDGGFDYATFDPTTSRVYMARPTYTTVIDVKTNKVSQLAKAAPGHMALPIPGRCVSCATRFSTEGLSMRPEGTRPPRTGQRR